MSSDILVVIPARGGSKGIPRKNLRSLAGRPLLYYSIRTALASRHAPDVVVSSEDAEIRATALKLGAAVVERSAGLSDDAATLDGVVYDATLRAEQRAERKYTLVVTAQATSPLLLTATLDAALDRMLAEPATDTLISAVDDRHLAWEERDGQLVPAYTARLNRQYLAPRYKETGGFFITRRTSVLPTSRFGPRVGIFPLSPREAIDVDTFADWALCEYHLRRKRIVLSTSGYAAIGLGHVYNLLALATGMVEHELIFVVDAESELAETTIAARHYTVFRAPAGRLVETVLSQEPDVIISDRLDTDAAYVRALRVSNARLIHFEDLGPGSKLADLVINAMYAEREVRPDHYFGHRYFCLRSEFLLTETTVPQRQEALSPGDAAGKVRTVLLSFGGVDPQNLTRRVLSLITPECQQRNIAITVVLGRGYRQTDTLAGLDEYATVLHDVPNMSDVMLAADLAFTSAGRTTFETASLGLPTIVLCQNDRETTHFFAGANYGFLNLGLGVSASDEEILHSFLNLVEGPERRAYMSELMLGQDIRGGYHRVLSIIKQAIEK